MTRHSKNSSSGSVFTYAERKKVSGVGTLKERFGVDSQKKFNACWLCLKEAVEPLTTETGHIYCKECLFLNFEQQKKDFEHSELVQAAREKLSSHTLNKIKKQDKQKLIDDFESSNFTFKTSSLPDDQSAMKEVEVDSSAPKKLTLKCPVSGKTIKIKKLLYLHPLVVEDKSSGENQWVCPIAQKEITHQKAGALKENGKIFLMTSIKNYLVEKSDNGYTKKMITMEDVVPLIPGGASFASQSTVETKKKISPTVF